MSEQQRSYIVNSPDMNEPVAWLYFHSRMEPNLDVMLDEPDCTRSFGTDEVWKKPLYLAPPSESAIRASEPSEWERLSRQLNGRDLDDDDKRAESFMQRTLDGLSIGPGNRAGVMAELAVHFADIRASERERDAERAAQHEELVRTWFVLKNFGLHPGRTNDKLSDCVRSALTENATLIAIGQKSIETIEWQRREKEVLRELVREIAELDPWKPVLPDWYERAEKALNNADLPG